MKPALVLSILISTMFNFQSMAYGYDALKADCGYAILLEGIIDNPRSYADGSYSGEFIAASSSYLPNSQSCLDEDQVRSIILKLNHVDMSGVHLVGVESTYQDNLNPLTVFKSNGSNSAFIDAIQYSEELLERDHQNRTHYLDTAYLTITKFNLVDYVDSGSTNTLKQIPDSKLLKDAIKDGIRIEISVDSSFKHNENSPNSWTSYKSNDELSRFEVNLKNTNGRVVKIQKGTKLTINNISDWANGIQKSFTLTTGDPDIDQYSPRGIITFPNDKVTIGEFKKNINNNVKFYEKAL